jgi:hypothetical protein
LKKLLLFIIGLIVLYLLVEPIARGIYHLIFGANSYFTFANPNVHLLKYFAIAIFVLVMIYVVFDITPAGKKVIPAFVLVLTLALLVTGVYFNATNEQQIVQQRLWKKDMKKWDEVKTVSTEATLEGKWRKPGKSLDPKLEYRIHFQDGSSVNVWDDISSLINLHKYIQEKGIPIEHKPVDQDIQDRPTLYIKGEAPQIKEVLGF